jgi:hypothetical protein
VTDDQHRKSFWITVAIACVPLVPTLSLLVVQQIRNNEQQIAHIEANSLAIERLRQYVEVELSAFEASDNRNVVEHDRARDQLADINRRLSAAEATIKGLQAKP